MYSSTYVQHADVIQRVTRQRLHINMNPIIIVNVHDLINVHLHQFQDLLHRVEHVPTNVMSDHIFEYRYGDIAHGSADHSVTCARNVQNIGIRMRTELPKTNTCTKRSSHDSC